MKRTPRRSRIPSPARSLTVLQTKRQDPNRSRSVDTDQRSTPTGANREFILSNVQRRISGLDFVPNSYLRDDTAVDSVRKDGSWWKALGDNSPFANEILQPIDNELEGTQVNKTNEYEASFGDVDMERRSKHIQKSLLVSGDSISPHSINVEKKTFFRGRKKPQKSVPEALEDVGSRENMGAEKRSNYLRVSPQISDESLSPHSIVVQRKTFFSGRNVRETIPNTSEENAIASNAGPISDETPSDIETTTHKGRKRQFFMKKPKAKKANIEIPVTAPGDENNETAVNKTNNLIQSKKIFFQQAIDGQPRGYEKFILPSSDSDDSLEQIETLTKANAHALQKGLSRALFANRKKTSIGKTIPIGSPLQSSTSDIYEFDNWKLLPSSTMIESAERSEIYPETPRRTMRATKRDSIVNYNAIMTDNKSDVAVSLQLRRSTRLSHLSNRMSSPMKEKENLNLENSPVTVSRKRSNVLDTSSENIEYKNRTSIAVSNHYSNNNKKDSGFQHEKLLTGQSLHSRSKSLSNDLQNISKNVSVSLHDSAQALETSKRVGKLLGPKSVREKRIKMLKESSLNNVETQGEMQILIPETMETETQSTSISPLRTSRSKKTMENIHSLTQNAHKSEQSNGIISVSKNLTSERLESMLHAHIEKDKVDDVQNDQTDEEIMSNDSELNFSFSHESDESNVIAHKSTTSVDIIQPSKRTSTDKSNRGRSDINEKNEIEENYEQNMNKSKESIVSTNTSEKSSKIIDNKASRSKEPHGETHSNRNSFTKSLSHNSNREEIQGFKIQNDEQIYYIRKNISNRSNNSRASAKIDINQSKQSGNTLNDLRTTISLHNSIYTPENISAHQKTNRTKDESRIQGNSVHQISNTREVIKSQQEIPDVVVNQNIVSRSHIKRVSTELTTNISRTTEISGKKSAANKSHRNSNIAEIAETNSQQSEQNIAESREKEIAEEKSVVDKSIHQSSKRNEREHVNPTLIDKTNENIINHKMKINEKTTTQDSTLLSKTSHTSTDKPTPGNEERIKQSINLHDIQLKVSENRINLSNNDQIGDVHVPALRYTGQKDLTRKSLNKSKQGPNTGKLGSSQSKQTNCVEKTQLEKYLDKIKEQNQMRKKQAEEAAKNLLKVPSGNAAQRNNMSMLNSLNAKQRIAKTKPKTNATKVGAQTVIDGKVYKPPKLYMPKTWTTVRLYKYLEKRLEPKFKLKTRVQSEKLVRFLNETSVKFNKDKNIDLTLISKLKREMARKDVVQTHYEFYTFVENYLPMELRLKIIPNLINGVPLPNNVYAKIL